MICPLISKTREPYPSIALSIFGVIVIVCLTQVKLLEEPVSKTELHIIEENNKTVNEITWD